MNFNRIDRTNIEDVRNMVITQGRLLLAFTEEAMAKLDGLTADVSHQRTVAGGTSTLLAGLADRLKVANDADDGDAIDDIVAELRESGAALARAVAQNTMAAGELGGAPASSGGAEAVEGPTVDHRTSDGSGLPQTPPEPGILQAERVQPQADPAGLPSAGGPGPDPSPDPTAGNTGVDALAGDAPPSTDEDDDRAA